MLIEIKGKETAIEELEKAKKLIEEAHNILWRLPSAISLEVSEGNYEVSESV